MRHLVLTLSLVTLPFLSIADQRDRGQPVTSAPAPPGVVTARLSQERLDEIRRSLTAQIAVYDRGEAAARAPSAEEAAELVSPASEATVTVALPGGGMALPTTAAHLSFAVATRDDDGTLRIAHRTGADRATTGGRHAR